MDHLATAPPEVRAIVDELRRGITSALGTNLVGLYLTGSLTYGDFDPGSSDIDYLAVLRRPLAPPERDALADLHREIGEQYPAWRERIEGSYVTASMLLSVEPPAEPRPYVNGGTFWDPEPRYGNEWLINRYALQECGIALAGPAFSDLVPPVSVTDVRAASARDLVEEWLLQLDDPAFLPDSHHQAYVTLTMCRILHRHANDEVVSKRQAAVWARDRLEPRLQDLIDAALAWQHGDLLDHRDDVREFVALTGHLLSAPEWSQAAGQADGTGRQANELPGEDNAR